MPPLIALGLAITALGLLGMVASVALPTARVPSPWPDRMFNAGYGLFCLALTYWLIVSVAAFIAEAPVHGL
ncbi:hypothetical protein [Sphingobium abikonense]|uniref:hypothetical protein n=1 Tax=Sphingobium abikonense TaxID=86193 RepID=UPI003515D9FF